MTGDSSYRLWAVTYAVLCKRSTTVREAWETLLLRHTGKTLIDKFGEMKIVLTTETKKKDETGDHFAKKGKNIATLEAMNDPYQNLWRLLFWFNSRPVYINLF